MISKGYEWLIENNVVKIDINLFRDFINNKIEALEPLEESKIVSGSAVKKTHTINKEMLLELQLELKDVKIPYT